ncbi:MAG: hypothetical protein ICV78_05815 [Tolypothrix sp. Co-bin9]|nr:hypothetical protein [Tolypothrix sp. Co-bin9]
MLLINLSFHLRSESAHAIALAIIYGRSHYPTCPTTVFEITNRNLESF